MKTLLFFVLFSGLTFAQITKDLSKKQAYELYKKSNVRIALGYKLSDFNRIYNTKNTVFTLDKESIILKSIKDKEELKKIQWYHARKPCIDCNTIIYENEETAKELAK